MDGEQLAAFAAVIELGSFDAAAQRLHVTPSAVSQRIKALEQRVGQVLVVRQKPCAATPAGVPLLRLAAQTALLEAEALAEMAGGSAQGVRVAIAVNADSMATWFGAVFGHAAEVLFDVRIEDQDHSARLLREGTVMGAVTTERTPVPGCRVTPLGVMRYVPVASRAYIERHLPDGFTSRAAAAAPSLAWNRDDALQDMLIRNVFRRVRAPTDALRTDGGGLRCRSSGRPGVGHVSPVAGRPGHRRRGVCRGFVMSTLMFRCSGSAGSWTAHWSTPSPMRSGRRLSSHLAADDRTSSLGSALASQIESAPRP